MQTSEETVAAIPPRFSRSFAWLLHADGPPGRARHSTSFTGYGCVRHWAYLLPCNHRKACQETKWTICDRALPADSKQISISIEAPLNSGTSCMVRDGKLATTHDSTLFGQEVRPYFPPGSTLMFDSDCFLTFGAKTTRSTCQFFGKYLVTHKCPDLRIFFNYLTGQNRDKKRVLRRHKVAIAARELFFDRGLRSHPAVMYRNCTASN